MGSQASRREQLVEGMLAQEPDVMHREFVDPNATGPRTSVNYPVTDLVQRPRTRRGRRRRPPYFPMTGS